MTRLCLDLFSGTGGFSSTFEDDPQWDTFRVEIDESFDADLHADIMDLEPADLPDPDVVVASPPCTVFSTAGNHDHWEDKRPVNDRAGYFVTLAYHAVGIIRGLSPEWWFLENPRGRLRWLFGQPRGTVTYCQYGKEYQKPTDLWGVHPPGMTYRSCPAGADCHASNLEDGGTSSIQSMPSDSAERARVPRELSRAVKQAVEAVPHRNHQPTLPGVVQ